MSRDAIACSTRAEEPLSIVRFLLTPFPPALRRSRLDLVLAAVVLLVGIVVRFAVIVSYDSPARHDFSDMANYIEGARQISAGSYLKGQFFQGIGYPLFLSAIGVGRNVWTWLVAVHLVASVLTLVLAWRCAALLVGERAAIFATAVMALDTPLVGIGAFAMPETVYTLTVTAALWIWLRYDRKQSVLWLVALGVAIALGSVLKGTIVILLPVLAVYLLVVSKRRLLAGGGVAVGMAAILFPLSVFVHHHYGVYKVGADNAGFSFMDGKCPWKYNFNTDGSRWLSPLNAQLGDMQTHTWTVPFDDSAYYFRAGLHCIKDDPIELVRSLRYVYFVFFDNDIWPVTDGPLAAPSHVTTMLWRVVVFPGLAFGALALVFVRKREHWIWLAFLLAPMALAYVFKAEARYRLPFDAIFVAVSTFGWKTGLSGLVAGGNATAGEVPAAFRRWEPRRRPPRKLRDGSKDAAA